VARKSHGDGLNQSEVRYPECPQCGAPPGTVCDRSDDPYPVKTRLELEAAGVSHYRRMLSAYGVPECRWDNYVERNGSGAMAPSQRSAEVIATGEVNCPVHKVPRGTPCPEWCHARLSKACMAARRRRDAKPAVDSPESPLKFVRDPDWPPELVREVRLYERHWRKFDKTHSFNEYVAAMRRAQVCVTHWPEEFSRSE